MPRDQAQKVIAGYTIMNDFSVRDWQLVPKIMPHTMGKSWDTHGPMGPCIVTADELSDPHHLAIRTWVNGELQQHANTAWLSEVKHRHVRGWVGVQDHGGKVRFREIYLHEAPDGRVYHLGNPATYRYSQMTSLIRRLGLPADPVPFDEWRDALFRKSMEGEAGEWNAFLPILEEVEVEQIFMPAFDASNTLAGLNGSGISCPPVGEELLGHYLKFFNEKGFF